MNGDNFAVILEATLGGSGLLAIERLYQGWRRRRLPKIEASEHVQQMALDMVGPLTQRLTEADREIDGLRDKVRRLNDELDRALDRAQVYKELLETHGIPVPSAR